MDTTRPRTAFTNIDFETVPIARTLLNACAAEGMRKQIFDAICVMLAGGEAAQSAFPQEVLDALRRLRAIDRKSQETVGYLFGDVKAPSINTHPYFVALDTLNHATHSDAMTVDNLRRLINAFKEGASPPADMPPAGFEAADVMALLPRHRILALERTFFGDPLGGSYSPDDEDE